jgi:hypothetical protein
MFIVYELFTFDNMFRLLLKTGYGHENALAFMMAHCSFSAYVFQERIHDEQYWKLSAENAISPETGGSRAQVIRDLMEIAMSRK